jgi:hypothetical protein
MDGGARAIQEVKAESYCWEGFLKRAPLYHVIPVICDDVSVNNDS